MRNPSVLALWMRQFLLYIFLTLLVACDNTTSPPALILGPNYLATPAAGKCCLVIAHAGGGIDGNSYSNSVEAIEANYRLGIRYFEIDFDFTADGHWAAVHDWKQWQRLSRHKGKLPPTLALVQDTPLQIGGKNWSIQRSYTPATLSWLQAFLSDHPDARIITDIKGRDRLAALLEDILAHDTSGQFIFQAYSPTDIDSIAKREPGAKIILTLYRMGMQEGIDRKIARRADKLWGITLPMNWAFEDDKLDLVRYSGLPLYLHGSPASINSRGLHSYFADRGINGFYLD